MQVFENQRYQPIRGWGSNYPGHMLPTDRRRYSDANGSQVFPMLRLTIAPINDPSEATK